MTRHLDFIIDTVKIICHPREMGCTATSCIDGDKYRIGKLQQGIIGGETNLIRKQIKS
jgi:hypothetical protein